MCLNNNVKLSLYNNLPIKEMFKYYETSQKNNKLHVLRNGGSIISVLTYIVTPSVFFYLSHLESWHYSQVERIF